MNTINNIIIILAFIKPITPIRNAGYDGIWNDVASHVNRQDEFRDTDIITQVHETTHHINNDISNKSSHKNIGLYVLNNMYYEIPHPKIKMTDYAGLIPQEMRTSRYNLYVVQQRVYFNDSPLYILDELVAYTNGSLVRKEKIIRFRDGYRSETFKNAMELTIFALYMKRAIKEKDPTYDFGPFDEFLSMNSERLALGYDSHAKAEFDIYMQHIKLLDIDIYKKFEHLLK